jgi:acyl carrier protein
LVSFLEEQYRIEFQPFELGVDYMDTIPAIVELVHSKL